jgi:hypothetical protein
MGKNQDDWVRLFMIPGMAHCGGGPGPNTFDAIGTMEYWRERGVAPTQMTAANPQAAITRPVCPYSAIREVQGRRQREGRRQLGVQHAVALRGAALNAGIRQCIRLHRLVVSGSTGRRRSSRRT